MRTGNLFDNLFVSVFFVFLPFTYALTLNIGFPFKISELALLFIFFIAFPLSTISLAIIRQKAFLIFGAFLIVTLFSMIANLFWTYPYSLNSYESRFGYTFDSILKFFYLFLSFAAFIVASNAFQINQRKYTRLFLIGGLLASIYSWYLFLSVVLHLPPLLLPGIQEPQLMSTSLGTFIRSGTFKEGNFMGLFILFCIIISFHSNRKIFAYFFIATLLTTFSSIGFVCAVFFLTCFYLKDNLTRKRLSRLIMVFAMMILILVGLMQNEDFKKSVLSKFTINEGISSNGEYSRVERINSAIVALRMGLANPILGVGISNYSRHYDHFNEDPRFINNTYSKGIPNNVFVEVFAETGTVGFLFFLYLLFLLYKKTKHDKSNTLKFGFLATMIYLLAFPTFSVLHVWVFFGLIFSLQNEDRRQ